MARRSAIVTGSASGIGKALCIQLAKKGYCLTVVDLDAASLMEQQQQLQQQSGVEVLVMAADVCDNKAMARAFKEHIARFQGLDLAVLNAGIGERGDFLDDATPTEALERTLDVDLRAVISGTRLAAQAMIAGGRGGRIVTVASAAGIFPMTAGPYYAAAKAGVVHFVRSLAPRLAPHAIQLTAICPQYVDTPLVQHMLQHQPDMAKAMMGPLFGQPLLQPEQVVTVIFDVISENNTLPEKGRRVPFREAYAGAGCVWLLLQNGRVVDPFAAANAPHQAVAGARTAKPSSSSSGSGSSGSGSRGVAAAGKQQQQQRPVSALAAASAASMARFSAAGALQGFARQALPNSYSKLQVVRLSSNFREAVQSVTVKMPAVPGGIPAGHVLVRRLFVGINASDINYTSGRYHGSSSAAASAAASALPYDAGFESVGVVVAAAPDVAGLSIGSAVATMDSGFSEYWLAPAKRVLPVPCPAPEVVALLTSGLTASLALEEVGGLQLPGYNSQNDMLHNNSRAAGTMDIGIDNNSRGATGGSGQQQQQQKQKTVLVTAAAGGTGQFAVQLAKLAGCHVVATCGGPAKAALLQQLGADRVIDYKSEGVKDVLKREYPSGIDLIYESVGGDMFATAVDALAPKGTLIIIGMMSAYGANWPPSSHPGLTEKLLWKSASVAGFFLLRYANQWGSHLARLCSLVQSGQLAVVLDPQPFRGLGSVPAAVEHLQAGASSGKVVVQIAEQLPDVPQGARL